MRLYQVLAGRNLERGGAHDDPPPLCLCLRVRLRMQQPHEPPPAIDALPHDAQGHLVEPPVNVGDLLGERRVANCDRRLCSAGDSPIASDMATSAARESREGEIGRKGRGDHVHLARPVYGPLCLGTRGEGARVWVDV